MHTQLVVGLRLKRIREALNISQPAIASRAKVSQQWISVVERGGTSIALLTLAKYTRTLRVPMYILFSPDDKFESFMQMQVLE